MTATYYPYDLQVEKQPYYESEDKIGYLDEMFPNFSYDPRDTDISNIKAGDCIYVRKNQEGVITYISAYNDYIMRYGKIISLIQGRLYPFSFKMKRVIFIIMKLMQRYLLRKGISLSIQVQ